MLSIIDKYLSTLKKCFREDKTFSLLYLAVLSFTLMTDDSGVTSMVRILFLDPQTYECLLKFFKTEAFSLEKVSAKWAQSIESSPSVYLYNNCHVLIGDHTKVSKEGKRMAASKAHHQDSGNFNKPSTIYGHHFGLVGIVIGQIEQKYCAPLLAKIHEGTEFLARWKGEKPQSRSLRLINDAIVVCQHLLHNCYIPLDRDFGSEDLVRRVLDYNASGQKKIHPVIRCKKNITCRRKLTAEEKAENKKLKAKGHPREYTPKVRPWEWFETKAGSFAGVKIQDGEKFQCFSRTEYWHNMKLLFVLTIDKDGKKAMFMTTDLKLTPKNVIELYKLRFNIEITFYDMKHTVHAFSYHFWVKGLEKLTKYNGKKRMDKLSEEIKPKVEKCICRTERFVNLAGMALGLLQLLALEARLDLSPGEIRFQRTFRHEDQLSIGQVKEILIRSFPFLLFSRQKAFITRSLQSFYQDLSKRELHF